MCSDHPSLDAGPGALSIGGVTFQPHSATAYIRGQPPVTFVSLSGSADACKEYLATRGLNDLHELVLTFSDGASDTHPVSASLEATAEARHFCSPGHGSFVDAIGGVITVAVNSPPTRVAGSYDLQFAGGEHISGSFDTCFCTSDTPCSTPIP